MNTPTIPPMPDVDCPSWCTVDHAADWQQHVAVGLDDRPIPAEGGGFLDMSRRTPLDRWCTLEAWMPVHFRTVGTFGVDGREAVEVVLSRDVEDPASAAYLYVHGEGSMTAAQARQLAALLLDGADALEAAQA